MLLTLGAQYSGLTSGKLWCSFLLVLCDIINSAIHCSIYVGAAESKVFLINICLIGLDGISRCGTSTTAFQVIKFPRLLKLTWNVHPAKFINWNINYANRIWKIISRIQFEALHNPLSGHIWSICALLMLCGLTHKVRGRLRNRNLADRWCREFFMKAPAREPDRWSRWVMVIVHYAREKLDEVHLDACNPDFHTPHVRTLTNDFFMGQQWYCPWITGEFLLF